MKDNIYQLAEHLVERERAVSHQQRLQFKYPSRSSMMCTTVDAWCRGLSPVHVPSSMSARGPGGTVHPAPLGALRIGVYRSHATIAGLRD